jgi:hypothetical protein
MIFQEGDICKGCSFDDGDHNIECRIKNKEEDKNCPCIKCIIKIMCNVPCPSFNELRVKLNIPLFNIF